MKRVIVLIAASVVAGASLVGSVVGQEGRDARGSSAGDSTVAKAPEAEFAAANQLYESGRFAEAAAAYQSIVDRGYESPALLFNLGNGYLKAGELGEAIVYYERARAREPRAEDIRSNLAHARSMVVDAVPAPGGSVFLGGLAALKDFLSVSEVLWLASGSLWLGLGAIAALGLLGVGRRPAKAVTGIALALIALTSVFAGLKVAEAARRRAAVILEREVQVRAGPGAHYTARFNLHEGTMVRILRTAGEYSEIELTPELGGWVEAADVLAVRP
jgi:tetratricopeptide (TPR) repeat protein